MTKEEEERWRDWLKRVQREEGIEKDGIIREERRTGKGRKYRKKNKERGQRE